VTSSILRSIFFNSLESSDPDRFSAFTVSADFFLSADLSFIHIHQVCYSLVAVPQNEALLRGSRAVFHVQMQKIRLCLFFCALRTIIASIVGSG